LLTAVNPRNSFVSSCVCRMMSFMLLGFGWHRVARMVQRRSTRWQYAGRPDFPAMGVCHDRVLPDECEAGTRCVPRQLDAFARTRWPTEMSEEGVPTRRGRQSDHAEQIVRMESAMRWRSGSDRAAEPSWRIVAGVAGKPSGRRLVPIVTQIGNAAFGAARLAC